MSQAEGSRTTLENLIHDSGEIMKDPYRVYDLVGQRFAFRCAELQSYFVEKPFRLGIVGNPNRGKTTYAYSAYLSLDHYGLPTNYVDLDIYSNSGLAIAGVVPWGNRPKKESPTDAEVFESISRFKNVPRGLVIGDFPGRADDKYQLERLKASDLVLLLRNDLEDGEAWNGEIEKAHVPMLWLKTTTDRGGLDGEAISPTVSKLSRKIKPYGIDLMVSLTRILEIIVQMNGVKLRNIWQYFTEAERVVLEEILDEEFASLTGQDIDQGLPYPWL